MNEFYPKMKKLYTCAHTSVWFKMSSAGFVGHTDINRTEGVFFFYMTRNSDTLYRFLFQNTGFLWLGIRTRSNYWSYGSNKLQSSKPWFRKISFGHVRLARQIGQIKWIKQLNYKKKSCLSIIIIYLYKKVEVWTFEFIATINL